MKITPLSFVFCLLSFLFALSAQATFYPFSKTGPAGDSGGKATQQTIAQAIDDADAMLETFASEKPSDWPDTWKPFAGTAAAEAAALAVYRVRMAFAELRNNWDSLSVQTVTLKNGWNAFDVYVDDPAPVAALVAPTLYADRVRTAVAANFADPTQAGAQEILSRIESLAQTYVAVRENLIRGYLTSVVSDWPIPALYVYTGADEADPQFTTDVSTEASASNPYRSWSAAAPDSYNLQRLSAGSICTAFSTGKVNRTVALIGIGVKSGSMRWHKTGDSTNPSDWNFLGLSILSGRPKVKDVLCDLDFTCSSFAKISGSSPAKPDFIVGSPSAPLTLADGDVLIASASATSSWYPAPTAEPNTGVQIAAGERIASFILKNDTAAAQTVTGTLHRTGCYATALTAIGGVEVCVSGMLGWMPWNFSEGGTTNLYFVDTLAAGESRRYRIRFDRSAFDLLAREKAYGNGFERSFSAVMKFRYGSNPVCTYLGFEALSNSGSVSRTWPAGLWVGTMTFNRVSQVKGNQSIVHDVPAGGAMMVRGIVHVDATNGCHLLHHVLMQTLSVTNADGEVSSQTRTYAGSAKPDDLSAGSVRRIDSIAMDISNPIVRGLGSLTNAVTFSWTVKPDGRANPLRHPYHPDHDGLQADYKTPAPDGDDMDNYRNGIIKPELWSIENTLRLKAELTDDSVDGSSLSGTCQWELGNMRRRVNGENIRANGTFSFRRIETVGALYGLKD